MARNMSFMLTTEQVRKGTKTVTRRMGWHFLKPGDVLNACVQCQGLKLGQKVEVIRQIRVVSTEWESLAAITDEEIEKEGFFGMNAGEFIDMFCRTHKECTHLSMVNRIEFEYI